MSYKYDIHNILLINLYDIHSRLTLITASCKNPIEYSVGQSVADRLPVRLQADREINLCHRMNIVHTCGITTVCSSKISEGVDKLMTSRHLCAIRLHERKTAMP